MSSRDEERQSQRGFKVEDRRRFAEHASADERGDETESVVETRAASAATEGVASQDASGEATEKPGVLPEMTFSTFVMGLTTQALMHLGEIEDPGRQVGRDLPAAKQMIDLLGILRDKTKGNLDAAEEQLLGNMLYDLRMRYVEVARNR